MNSFTAARQQFESWPTTRYWMRRRAWSPKYKRFRALEKVGKIGALFIKERLAAPSFISMVLLPAESR